MKFSIIFPVYNVEMYIRQCLESVYLQKYADYECLIINEDSTDSSEIIAQQFCKENSNFHYYKKENGGDVDARNFGLKLAIGEYIIFIDSDYLISKRYLLSIDYLLNHHCDADLVHINYKRFNDRETIVEGDSIDCMIAGKIAIQIYNEEIGRLYFVRDFKRLGCCFTVSDIKNIVSIINSNKLYKSFQIQYSCIDIAECFLNLLEKTDIGNKN